MDLSYREKIRLAKIEYRTSKSPIRISALAKKHGIKPSTLWYHIRGKTRSKGLHDSRFLMSDYEEKILEAHVIYMTFCLAPPTRQIVIEIACEMTGSENISRRWLDGFVKRSKFLEFKGINHLDVSRARTSDGKYRIELFFELLQYYIKFFNVKKDHVWNIDETGFHVGEGTKGNEVVTVKGACHTKSYNQTETVSVMEMISMTGEVKRPLFIYKGTYIMPEWIDPSSKGDELISCNDKGSMKIVTFDKWIDLQISSIQTPDGDEWGVLIMDGHKSHTTRESIRKLLKKRIIPIYFPSHMTNILQPLDRTCFGISKILVRKHNTRSITRGIEPTKDRFMSTYMSIRDRAFSKEAIMNAWNKTGLANNDFSVALKEYNRQMNRSVLPIEEYKGMSDPPGPSGTVPPTIFKGSARTQIRDMRQQDDDTLAKAWAERDREINKLRLENMELRNIVDDSKSLFNLQKLDLEAKNNRIKDLVQKVNRKRRNRIPECNDDVVMECEAIRNLDNPQVRAIILRNEDGTYTP